MNLQPSFPVFARRTTPKRHIWQLITVLALLVLIFAGLPAQHVYADSLITVNTTADNATAGDGFCTLREVINNANADSDTTSGDCTAGSGDETITFGVSGTIPLTSQLSITDATSAGKLTIDGGGVITLDGGGTTPFFNLISGADATLNGLTMTHGYSPFAAGGINNHGGTLTMTNSILSHNLGGFGGGIYNSGGTLTVSHSTISNNEADLGSGGGIFNSGGTLTISGSTISSNTARNATYVYGGGLYVSAGTETVINSTFTDNQADFDGSALYVLGNSAAVTVINSTIAGNHGSTAVSTSNDTLDHTGTLNLYNSILADNDTADCSSGNGTINAQNSLIGDGLTCVNGTNTNNLTGDPSLGALTGSPAYYPLSLNSIAVDAGDNALVPGGVTTDEVGNARIQGPAVDMGAYESPYTPAAPTITTQPQSQMIASGQTATLTVVASGTSLTYQWYQGTSGDTSTPVGSDSDSFTTPALTSDTSYWVRVSNPAGSVDSDTATLSINRPPTITSANSTSFTEGAAGSFTVTTAAGVPAATTISESGALPGGVSFTDNGDGTATLSGTPAIGTFGTYNLTITASNGVAPDATQDFTLNVLPDTVQITVETDPSGLSFTVDGTTYTSSQTFTWTHGASHTLATTSPQAGTPGTQYVFDNWSDSGAISHSVTAPGTDTTYTASFKTQYQLTTAVNPSNGGSVSPASGAYYDANTDASLTATANSGFAFLSWTGNVAAATAANTTITMSGPQSVTANFKASTLLLYNGDQVVNIGNSFNLAAQLSSPASACLSGQTISFSLDVNPLDGSAGPYSLGSATTGSNGQATLSVSTSGWQEGIYDITASFAGTTDCDPASDDATLTAASPGDSATGGGWYTLSGSGHINFGFNVRKVDSNCQSNCAYKGQVLLINNGKWRLKGTLDSYVETSTGQGAASGSGNLYWWDQSLNGGLGDWSLAQSGVSFTINFYDSGQKGKKSSDTFGINIQYVPVPPQPNALPNSDPQLLKGGDIKVN